MPQSLSNPFRGTGIEGIGPLPSTQVAAVAELLQLCPKHRATPVLNAPEIAQSLGIAELWIKDERTRMGLGSFKALGAAHAIAREAAASKDTEWSTALSGRTFVTASAGNHGLSVAAGAHVFGAQAVIFLAETVPSAFAERLESKGAQTVRAGHHYEEAMQAASDASAENGWALLSDSSWPGYTEPPFHVMEGYLQMAAEAVDALPHAPTHIVLQAGVGGMAAAVAAFARHAWGDAPEIVAVEPEAAPALIESIKAGKLVDTDGPVSCMGRLDCKTPSMIALAGLSRDADLFVTVSETEAQAGAQLLEGFGIATTPSGGAGAATLLAGVKGITHEANVLIFVTEGPEDG